MASVTMTDAGSLSLREQAANVFQKGGWQMLFRCSGGNRVSATLLDPSERLQVTLQIPVEDDGNDWVLWLEACGETPVSSNAALMEPMGLRQMLDVASWLQGPIAEIERMALASGNQLVLQLAGSGPNS
jgi:hypothetical protein